MIRTVLWIVLLGAAVFLTPLWVQMILFVAAIISGPYRFFFVIPAIVSDAIYAPGSVFMLSSHDMLIFVLVLLLIHWFIMKKLRIRTIYGLEA
jgi:hypothetical protein